MLIHPLVAVPPFADCSLSCSVCCTQCLCTSTCSWSHMGRHKRRQSCCSATGGRQHPAPVQPGAPCPVHKYSSSASSRAAAMCVQCWPLQGHDSNRKATRPRRTAVAVAWALGMEQPQSQSTWPAARHTHAVSHSVVPGSNSLWGGIPARVNSCWLAARPGNKATLVPGSCQVHSVRNGTAV